MYGVYKFVETEQSGFMFEPDIMVQHVDICGKETPVSAGMIMIGAESLKCRKCTHRISGKNSPRKEK